MNMRDFSGAGRPRTALFFVVTALFWFSNYAYMPNMTPYLKSLGIGYTLIGSIGGAYGLGQLLLRIPLGMASDRLGRRKLFVVAGIAMGALSALLLYFEQSPLLIWLLRFTAGFSASAWVVYTVLFSSYFSGEKLASRVSVLGVANTLGIMLANLSGSIIVRAFGYRAAFLLSAGVGTVGVILSLFVTENVPARRERPGIAALAGVVRDKNLLVLSLLAVFLQMAMFSTATTFTPEVAARLGADAVQLGVLSTLNSLTGLVASAVLGWWFGKKVNFRLLLVAGFLCGGLGTVFTAFSARIWMVYAAGMLAGLGFGFCFTALMGYCTMYTAPEKRGVAMGFFQAVYSIGMFMGPVLVGGCADLLGLRGGMLCAAAIAVLGAALSALLLGTEGARQKQNHGKEKGEP